MKKFLILIGVVCILFSVNICYAASIPVDQCKQLIEKTKINGACYPVEEADILFIEMRSAFYQQMDAQLLIQISHCYSVVHEIDTVIIVPAEQSQNMKSDVDVLNKCTGCSDSKTIKFE